MLKDILISYCPDAEIWAYGSRLNGDAHSGSDLDLVVKDFHSKNAKLYELKNLFSESNIPFTIDIQEFYKLPKSFQDEILKNYIILKKILLNRIFIHQYL